MGTLTRDKPRSGPCEGMHTWEATRPGPRRTQWTCAGCGSVLDLPVGEDPDDVVV